MLGSCSLLVEPDRSYPSQKGKLRTPNWRIVLLFVIVVTIAAIFVFPASLSKTCHVLSKGLLVSNTHNYVPKVIWQTYKTKQLPKEAAQASQTWTDLNPGWKHELWDDSDIEDFLLQEFDERTLAVFKAFPYGVMKADFWRYAVMYVYGGLYADIDAISVKPIDEWLDPSCTAVIGLENDAPRLQMHFCQWSFLAQPKHPLFKAAVELVVNRAWDDNLLFDKMGEHMVHHYTGPAIWTQAVKQVLSSMEPDLAKEKLTEIPSWMTARFLKDKYGALARAKGICIQEWAFFGKDMVENLYGSQFFKDGYDSWTEKVLKDERV